MNILKTLLKIVIALIILVLVVAFFTKKSYEVERSITINKPKQTVYDYIKYLKNQNEYSKWVKMDPNIKLTESGTDATVGYTSAWDSDMDNVGKGEQKITKVIDGEGIETEIHFIKPFESTSPAYMRATTVSDSVTKVSWGFKGNMVYPTNVLMLCMNMDKMIGDDLDVGLKNLKNILEK